MLAGPDSLAVLNMPHACPEMICSMNFPCTEVTLAVLQFPRLFFQPFLWMGITLAPPGS